MQQQQRLGSYQRSLYESIPSSENASSSAVSPRRSRRFSYFLGALVLVALALASPALFTLSDYIPTAQDRSLADAWDLPLTSIPQLKREQRLADISSSWNAKDHPDVIAQIVKKHGTQKYMDVPDGCEATVMLVRHCEKGDIREHCNYLGFERSVYLASLFGDDPHARWPAPEYIFAMTPGGRHNKHKMNYREVETVGPLANKTGVTVDTSYDSDSIRQLSREIRAFLHTGNMCGKVTVISWKHSEIAKIARHLGCGPMEGCPLDYRGRDFDSVWQVHFVHRKFDHSNRKNLRLPDKPVWRVYGSVQPEGFDPLAVSKQFGDYPVGGTAMGGRWQKADTSFPERKKVQDKNGWRTTRVGFSKSEPVADNEQGDDTKTKKHKHDKA